MKKNFSKPVTRCQISNSKNLESLLFLGFLPPVNTLRKIGSILNEEITFKLIIGFVSIVIAIILANWKTKKVA